MSKRSISLALSVFIFIAGVKAQSDFRPGYIITLHGDTIKGLINYRSDIANSKECIFKKEADQEKVVYTPDQIESYLFIDGKYYISSNSLNYKFKDHVFVEYVIKGLVSIYFYRDEEKNHYFISKDTLFTELDHYVAVNGMSGDDNLAAEKSQTYKGQLKYLMRDQPSIYKKVDGIVCNTKDLISLTNEYQQLSCPSQECMQYEKKTKKDVKIKFGIFYSVGLSHLSSPPYNMYINDYDVIKSLDFKTTFTHEIGTTFDLYLNVIGENKYIIQVSPALNFVNYKSYTERLISPLIYSYKVNIKFTTLKIPLIFKYSFYSSNWLLIPYIKIGAGCAIYLNQKGTYEYGSVLMSADTDQGQDFIQSLTTSYDTKPKKFYFLAGAGTDIKCGERLLFIGATYEYGDGQLKGSRSDAQLQVGFQF